MSIQNHGDTAESLFLHRAQVEVSVVIPTKGRPVKVVRAIRSALAQTFQQLEIIVVVDGPDPLTDPQELQRLDDRVRVIMLPANVGLAEARNQGIHVAHGRWIALLDDDDEWLPDKLTRQCDVARALGGEYVFVPCRFLEKTAGLERIMPTVLPHSAENFSEYIYCENGYLQPSMFFMSRALCLEVPFTKGLRHIEDSDWLLRAARHPSIRIGAVPEPLSIYYNIDDGKRESEGTPWRLPLDWGIVNQTLFTRRAFPFFVARLGVNARTSGEPLRVLFLLVRAAGRYGSLTPKALLFFIACWFLPRHTRRQVRLACSRCTSALRAVHLAV